MNLELFYFKRFLAFQMLLVRFVELTILLTDESNNNNPCYLPKGCQIKSKIHSKTSDFADLGLSENILKCDLTSDNIIHFDSPKIPKKPLNDECKLGLAWSFPNKQIEAISLVSLIFNPWSDFIIGPTLNFSSILTYMRTLQENKFTNIVQFKNTIVLNHIHGFQINAFRNNFRDFSNKKVTLKLKQSKFHLYLNETKRIDSCHDLVGIKKSDLFEMGEFLFEFNLDRCQYDVRICPLVFRNAGIIFLTIGHMIQSYLKTNVLGFFKLENSTSNLNARIAYVFLKGENIDIDENLLNRDVFKNVMNFWITGQVNLIQIDVFKSFRNLKTVSIKSTNQREIFHRNGLDWIRSIKEEINVDLGNLERGFLGNKQQNPWNYRYLTTLIILSSIYSYREDTISMESRYPDVDFCLYRNFPFQQLIAIINSDYEFIKANRSNEFIQSYLQTFTCTFMWLIQFYPLYYKYHLLDQESFLNLMSLITSEELANKSKLCNFAKLLENCNKSSVIQSFAGTDTVETKINIDYFRMILIFVSPLVLTIGLCTNLVVIQTVSKNLKTEEMKDRRQYEFMRINSGSNCSIYLIHLIGMISQCTHEFWCSIFNQSVFVQYYKIVFIEFLGTFFRFMSNFTTVAYSLSRLALIGQEHGILVTKISKETKMKRIIGLFVLLSLILSIVKYFKYIRNDLNDESQIFPKNDGIYYLMEIGQMYPLKYNFFPFIFERDSFEMTKSTVISIFNIICDVVNYPTFLVLDLVIDLYTAYLLKKTLTEKMKSVSSDEVREKKEKEIKNAIKRMRAMIISTVIKNLFLRLPVSINSIFEIIITFIYDPQSSSYWGTLENFYNVKSGFVYFCLGLNGCEMFEDLSDFFYFISLSLSLLFYNKFDLNFNECFSRSILKNKQNTSQSAPKLIKFNENEKKS